MPALLSETEEEQQTPLATEFPEEAPSTLPVWANTLVAKAAVIRSEEAEGFLQETPRANLEDPVADFKAASAERVGRQRDAIIDQAQTIVPPDTPSAVAHVQATQEMLGEEDLALVNQHISYFNALDDGTTDPEELKQLAREGFVADMSVQVLNAMGWRDKVEDILEMFLPSNVLIDNKNISGNLFDTKEYLTRVIGEIEELPIKEQLLHLATFFNELQDDTGNDFKAVDIISKLVLPEEPVGDRVDTVLDVLDVATFGVSVLARAGSLVRSTSVLKDAAEVGGRRAEVGVVNTAAAQDPDFAEAIGTNSTTSMANAVGIRVTEGVDPQFAEGLSVESQRAIGTFREEALRSVENIVTERTARRESILTPQDRTRREQELVSTTANRAEVVRAEIVERRGDSIVIAVEREGGDIRGEELPLALDANGHYNDLPEDHVVRGALASPSVVFQGTDFLSEVKGAQRVEQAATGIAKELRELQNRAIRDVAGTLGVKRNAVTMQRALARIDHVLLEGDRQARVFTPTELGGGVNGVSLSKVEVEAYYKVRAAVDASWVLRNWADRRALEVQGHRGVWVDRETAVVAKTASRESAGPALQGVTTVYDARTRTSLPRENLRVDDIYDSGGTLVKLRDPLEVDAGVFRTLIVSAEDVGDLPFQVLNYRKGYVPKVDLQSRFFAKNIQNASVDGALVVGGRVTTLRKFRDREEAEVWAKAQPVEEGGRIEVFEDREVEKMVRAMSFGQTNDTRVTRTGGMFRGSRSEEEIPFGLAGSVAPRLGAFESLSYNMANLSNIVSWNTWRLSIQARIVNTAKKAGIDIQSLADIDKLGDDLQVARQLKRMKAQVDDWARVPTKSERWFQHKIEGALDAVGGRVPEGMANAMARLSFRNPVAAAKGATFNLYLGIFNPVQLFVQAQGAAVSLSRNLHNPVAVAQILNQQAALKVGQLTQAAGPAARTLADMPLKEFDEMMSLWKRSGLETSVLTTADHGAVVAGFGITRGMLRRFIETGQIFYQAGELFNRRTAFVTALRTWKSKNPGRRLLRQAEEEVLEDTNNLLLEMGAANRAQWQRGVLGLPTQFMQVVAKSLETLTPLGGNKNFGRFDRAKILAAQVALYGSAGVPLGAAYTRYVADQVGIDQEDIQAADEGVLKLINDGITGWLTLAVTGADVDTGDRLALLSGIEGMIEGLLSGGETSLSDMLGAMGGKVNTFWATMDSLSPLVFNAEDLDSRDLRESFGRAARVISTWTNVEKALVMHNYSEIRDSRGGVKIRRDFTGMEEIMRAIGFRLDEEVGLDQQHILLQVQKQVRRKIVDRAILLTQSYEERDLEGVLAPNDTLDFERERDALFATLPLGERLRAERSYWTKLRQPRLKSAAVHKQWLRAKANSAVDGLESIRAKLLATSLTKVTE